MQIETCRARLEDFEQSLNRELYRFYSGQKERLETAAIYSNYSDLYSLESIREAEEELKRTSESLSGRHKSLQRIIGFLIDQHLDSAEASLIQEDVREEACRTLPWDGKKIALSRVPSSLRNEPDAMRRRILSERRAVALGGLELKRERVGRLHAAATKLGFDNYVQAQERIRGTDFSKLLSSLDGILSRLGGQFRDPFRVSFETTLGIPLNEAGSWDVGHWRKRNDRESVFTEDHLLPVVEATVYELGIRPERPEAIRYDLDQRARARPVCVPVRIPQEIKIVMSPGNGSGRYAALLHEGGHAHHFAWTSPSLAVEYRISGDRALSEAYAFLFEHLILNPQWLGRMLSFAKSREFLQYQALVRVFLVGRCTGSLRFCLSLYAHGAGECMGEEYAETMEAYTGLRHRPEFWADALSDGLGAADYLRGWMLEAMLEEYLRSRFGTAWFRNRAAAAFLKEIWETGLLYSADELCREIGIGALEPEILAEKLAEGLKP